MCSLLSPSTQLDDSRPKRLFVPTVDPVTLILLSQIGIAAAMVFAGIYTLIKGIKLYRDGIGLRADGTEVQLKKVKLSLKTAGSVVMALSAFWGFFSWQTVPKRIQTAAVLLGASASPLQIQLLPIEGADPLPVVANVVTFFPSQSASFNAIGSAVLEAPSVTWTTTGGSITFGGLYTAPDTSGVFLIIARSGEIADTAIAVVQ